MKMLKEKILKYASWLCLGSRSKDDKGKKQEENTERVESENQTVIINEENQTQIEEIIDSLNKGKDKKAKNSTQQWLDNNYSENQRANVKKLDISNKNLEGSLNLDGFSGLEELYCGGNKLTDLDISGCSNLGRIHCSDNQLTALDLSNCSNLEYLHCAKNQLNKLKLPNEKEKLKQLVVHDNKLEQDLFFFDGYTNLEEIYLGGNLFFGSLEPLKSLNKLKNLDISDNNIDSGLEHLPDSINEFHCYAFTNLHADVSKIFKELKPFATDVKRGKYNWEKWKENNKFQSTKKWTDAQQWLVMNYPNKNVEEIYINQQLEGALDPILADFDKLKKICISYYVDRGKFEIKSTFFSPRTWWSNKLEEKEIQIIQLINAQEYINQEYPTLVSRKKVTLLDISKKNLEGELNLIGFVNLDWLSCNNNYLTSLGLSDCSQLTHLDCGTNQLTNLDINNLNHLMSLSCSSNYLTKLIYPINSKRLAILSICDNNFPEKDLTTFSQLTNLQHLSIGNINQEKINQGIYNRFVGSLEPLKCLNELKYLDIDNTDIDRGLEYLPDSLERLKFSTEARPQSKVGKIQEELFLLGENLRLLKENNFRLVDSKRKVTNSYENQPLKTLINMPLALLIKEDNKEDLREDTAQLTHPERRKERLNLLGFLLVEEESKVKENYEFIKKNYQKVIFRDNISFFQKSKQEQLPPSKSLPIKLYNIETGKVEWTANNSNIKNYATLSYVWGSMRDKSLLEDIIMIYQKDDKEYEENITITKWGKKSLAKAKEACKLLGIDYLWIDQLCINQKDREEKAEEVRKMRNCYGESDVTLISINTNSPIKENKRELVILILKKIINSEWFTRSWTFQEGLLSKHTIFMFDDCLIDGKLITRVWTLLEKRKDWILDPRSTRIYYPIVNKDNMYQFVTPLGWVDYENNSDLKDQVNVGLFRALSAIKDRARNNPIDGIYSILGLLPYGDKVKVKYKRREEKYTTEELEKVLLDVTALAIQEGNYREPLTWIGLRRSEPCLWWIPEVDEKGSIRAWGSINVNCESGSVEITESGFKLLGSVHRIEQITSSSLVGGNIWEIEVNVDAKDYFFVLQISEETLKKIDCGDTLIIPNVMKWKIEDDKDKKFAILLLSKKNKDDFCMDIAKWQLGRRFKSLSDIPPSSQWETEDLRMSRAYDPCSNSYGEMTYSYREKGPIAGLWKEWQLFVDLVNKTVEIADADFYDWLRNTEKTNIEQVSKLKLENIKQLFNEYQLTRTEQIQIPPK